MVDSNPSNNTSSNVCLPGIVLKSALPLNKLSICCLNTQSICARKMSKFDELKQIINLSNIDVICVVESWLNNEVNNNIVHIPGYNIVRHD